MAKLLLLYIKSKALQNQQLKIRIILTSYKSLETSTVTKNDGSLIKTEYTVNSLGDVKCRKSI